MTIGDFLVEMLAELSAAKNGEPMTIVEVGTIRQSDPAAMDLDGASTLKIAYWLKDRKTEIADAFYSVEINPTCVAIARQTLASPGLGLGRFVEHILGDGATVLRHMDAPIDFLFLDGGNDPTDTLAQFEHARKRLRQPAIVVIDDVFNPREANKGLLVVPLARLDGLLVAKVSDRLAAIAFGVEAEGALKHLSEHSEHYMLLPSQAEQCPN